MKQQIKLLRRYKKLYGDTMKNVKLKVKDGELFEQTLTLEIGLLKMEVLVFQVLEASKLRLIDIIFIFRMHVRGLIERSSLEN